MPKQPTGLSLLVLNAQPERVVDAGSSAATVMGDAVDSVRDIDLDTLDIPSKSDGRIWSRRELERIACAKDAADVRGKREVDHVAHHRLTESNAIE